MRKKVVLEKGRVDTGGKYSNRKCEESLACGCVCVSALSVNGVPVCGFLLPQSSPYLPPDSTADKCVSEEIKDFCCVHAYFVFVYLE